MWLAVGRMNGLVLQMQQALGRDPSDALPPHHPGARCRSARNVPSARVHVREVETPRTEAGKAILLPTTSFPYLADFVRAFPNQWLNS